MKRSYFILFSLLFFLFACGVKSGQTQKASEKEVEKNDEVINLELTEAEKTLAENGKAVYNTYCIACHMDDGNGIPGMNPPLRKTDWVNGDKERLIKVILNGLTEAIEIEGETYSNIMNPHDFLSDEDIAGVLTFIKNNFDNHSGAISPEEVKKVRVNNEG